LDGLISLGRLTVWGYTRGGFGSWQQREKEAPSMNQLLKTRAIVLYAGFCLAAIVAINQVGAG